MKFYGAHQQLLNHVLNRPDYHSQSLTANDGSLPLHGWLYQTITGRLFGSRSKTINNINYLFDNGLLTAQFENVEKHAKSWVSIFNCPHDLPGLAPQSYVAYTVDANQYLQAQELGMTKQQDQSKTARLIGEIGQYRLHKLTDIKQYHMRTVNDGHKEHICRRAIDMVRALEPLERDFNSLSECRENLQRLEGFITQQHNTIDELKSQAIIRRFNQAVDACVDELSSDYSSNSRHDKATVFNRCANHIVNALRDANNDITPWHYGRLHKTACVMEDIVSQLPFDQNKAVTKEHQGHYDNSDNEMVLYSANTGHLDHDELRPFLLATAYIKSGDYELENLSNMGQHTQSDDNGFLWVRSPGLSRSIRRAATTKAGNQNFWSAVQKDDKTLAQYDRLVGATELANVTVFRNWPSSLYHFASAISRVIEYLVRGIGSALIDAFNHIRNDVKRVTQRNKPERYPTSSERGVNEQYELHHWRYFEADFRNRSKAYWREVCETLEKKNQDEQSQPILNQTYRFAYPQSLLDRESQFQPKNIFSYTIYAIEEFTNIFIQIAEKAPVLSTIASVVGSMMTLAAVKPYVLKQIFGQNIGGSIAHNSSTIGHAFSSEPSMMAVSSGATSWKLTLSLSEGVTEGADSIMGDVCHYTANHFPKMVAGFALACGTGSLLFKLPVIGDHFDETAGDYPILEQLTTGAKGLAMVHGALSSGPRSQSLVGGAVASTVDILACAIGLMLLTLSAPIMALYDRQKGRSDINWRYAPIFPAQRLASYVGSGMLGIANAALRTGVVLSRSLKTPVKMLTAAVFRTIHFSLGMIESGLMPFAQLADYRRDEQYWQSSLNTGFFKARQSINDSQSGLFSYGDAAARKVKEHLYWRPMNVIARNYCGEKGYVVFDENRRQQYENKFMPQVST